MHVKNCESPNFAPCWDEVCPLSDGCDRSSFARLRTLKTDWLTCLECGSSFGTSRKPHFLSRLFDIPRTARRMLLRNTDDSHRLSQHRSLELTSSQRIYSRYAEMLTKQAVDLQRWYDSMALDVQRRRAAGVSPGMRCLFISGGPGLLAQHFKQELDCEVVTTEFSPLTALSMSETLGLDARQYDLNTDTLSQVVDGSFDFIDVESVLDFCLDKQKFVDDLIEVCHDGTVVLVSLDHGTLGYFLTWMFDDYVPLRLENIFSFTSFMQSKGFKPIFTFKNKYLSVPFRFQQAMSSGSRRIRMAFLWRIPFLMVYGLKAFIPPTRVNRSWHSVKRGIFLVYAP